MNIILLPGLDGTGELFEELIPCLGDNRVHIIALPQEGDQTYKSLTSYVTKQLPREDFILVAESFSGPIGVLLSQSGLQNMKGIIFVATFLTPPKKFLIAITKLLPIKQLLQVPFSSLLVRYLMLGHSASDKTAKRFFQVISKIPNSVIKKRLSTVQKFTLDGCQINLPATYIRAKNDKLVPKNKCLEFDHYFTNLTIKTITGPHFILQACPVCCAEIILNHID